MISFHMFLVENPALRSTSDAIQFSDTSKVGLFDLAPGRNWNWLNY